MRRLAVSVATGRVSAVFFENGQLLGWCRSAKAFGDVGAAKQMAQNWIAGFGPQQLVTEDAISIARKGSQSQRITEAIAHAFADADCLDVRVRRIQRHENKYEEAAVLAEQFPPAQSILPKRPPIWLPEPRNMGYFEALALVAELNG